MEKTQEQIKFEIVCANLGMKRNKEAHITSVYNICYRWLYAYSFRNYDTCTVGWDSTLNKGVITDWGTKFTYYIDEKRQIPIFEFPVGQYQHCKEYQEAYLNGLDNNYENPYAKYLTD